MSHRNLNEWFLPQVKVVTVRNLFPQSLDIFLQALPCPRICISATKDDVTKHIYESSIQNSCNPSWTLGDSTPPFKDTSWNECTILKITITDSAPTESSDDGDVVLLEVRINLRSVVFLGDTSFEELPKLPLNAIFFITDHGLWASEDTFNDLQRLESNDSLSGTTKNMTPRESFTDGNVDRDMYHNEDRNDANKAKHIELSLIEVEKLRIELSKHSNERTAHNSHNKKLEQRLKLANLTLIQEAADAAEKTAIEEEAALAAEQALIQDTDDLQTHLSECSTLHDRFLIAEKERSNLRETGCKTRFLLEARQLKLLSELQTIYPIEPYWPAEELQLTAVPQTPQSRSSGNQSKAKSSLERHVTDPHQPSRWVIRGIELPPLDCPAKDEEQLATALGYIVHVVLLLSKYQQINLRYQLLYYSSRSMIRDPTASGSMNQNLPLYRSNTEPERFRKAVLWLAKDIEQIIMTKGMTYDRNKGILFNLHTIFKNELIPQFN